VLELWEKGSDHFKEIEAYLRAAGFFAGGARRLVADLYVGYGVSRRLRRTTTPDPPEPCALPLAACRVRTAGARPAGGGTFSIGEWQRSWVDDAYAAAIVSVKRAIADGDVYQVNLVQHLSAPFGGDPRGLAGALAPLEPLHPAPLGTGRWAIVSASPELFLARRGRRVWTKPIKGTRPVDSAQVLRESRKDAAEHVMIVDLERNDLARVCEPGSLRWPDLMTEHQLAGVSHLVTTVEGRLRAGVGLAELLEASRWVEEPRWALSGRCTRTETSIWPSRSARSP
jgi:para-aminobenzoate synthetase component 1